MAVTKITKMDAKEKVVEKNEAQSIIFPSIQKSSTTDVRSFSFDTERQRNARFIQKGISKPGRISYEVLRRAVNSVHIARICVNVLKEKITKTKWVIKYTDPLKKDKDDARIDEVTELFKHPNKNNDTFRTLLDKMLEDLLVLDSVTLEKTRFPNGKLAELHYVDSATIRPVFDEYGNQDVPIPLNTEEGQKELPVSYVQVFNNSPYGGPEAGELVAAWPKKDMVHFNMHPQGAMESFGYGLSPLEGVLSVVANLLNADNFNGTYFEEGSFTPLILQLKGNIAQRDLEAMREYLYSELTGSFHRPAIMAGAEGAEVINLKDISNREMQFQEYINFLARLLAAAYGLSGQDIGLVDDLNKATSQEQTHLSEEKGYGSVLHLLKEVFNQEVIWKDFGYDDLEFEWIEDDRTDPEASSRLYDTSLKNGTMTLNEVRQKMGLLPFEAWADEPAILTGNGYVTIAQGAMVADENQELQDQKNPFNNKEEEEPTKEGEQPTEEKKVEEGGEKKGEVGKEKPYNEQQKPAQKDISDITTVQPEVLKPVAQNENAGVFTAIAEMGRNFREEMGRFVQSIRTEIKTLVGMKVPELQVPKESVPVVSGPSNQKQPVLGAPKAVPKAETATDIDNTPEEKFERHPFMVGDMVIDRKLVEKYTKLFGTQNIISIVDEGFSVRSYTYDYPSALRRLRELIDSKGNMMGGLVTTEDQRGICYIIYYKEYQESL